jgi:class 3 adenylate cyclase
MDAAGWIGVIAGVVTIAGALLAYAKWGIQAPLSARNEDLERKLGTEHDRLSAQNEELERRLNAERDQLSAHNRELERKLDTEHERLVEVDGRFKSLQADFDNLKAGNSGVILKHEIDTLLLQAMESIGVREGSVLIPGPPPDTPFFVFLSIFGPAAGYLRQTRSKVARNKGIVGRVFETGTPYSTDSAYDDPNFFAGIDKKGKHQTRSMLAIPVRENGQVIGVVQFLNKPRAFTAQDQALAESILAPVGSKIIKFTASRENFELLGLAWRSDDKEATIAFCDLTASSSLLAQMNVPSAIDCINEYLQRQCDVAMREGATIDKYIGDGVMLRFNVPRALEEHPLRAVEAAVKMQADYARLKEDWVNAGFAVEGVHSRIGISCGSVYPATIGHPQFQQITVIGKTVNRAAALCESAPRDGDVIVIDRSVLEHVSDRVSAAKLSANGGAPESFAVLELK